MFTSLQLMWWHGMGEETTEILKAQTGLLKDVLRALGLRVQRAYVMGAADHGAKAHRNGIYVMVTIRDIPKGAPEDGEDIIQALEELGYSSLR